MGVRLARITTPDVELQGQLDRHVATLNAGLGAPLLGGVLTDAFALTTSFQNLAHGLGRRPLGWIVVAPNADARIWEDPAASNNQDPTRLLRLRASAAVTCRLWVF